MHSPSSMKAGVVANYAGQFMPVVLGIVFTPVYIHFLGIESYGLIGFYITLQGSLAVLEMGLKSACVRELSYFSAKGKKGALAMRNTLRSLEVLYWLAALLIGILLVSSSSWISRNWLNTSVLSTDQLENVLFVIAWVIALRWPTGLYQGALTGLQRQLLLNGLLVMFSIMNWLGSVLVLWLIQADIIHFFLWQSIVSVISSLVFAIAAWASMPKAKARPAFSLQRLKEILPFVAGTGSNAVLGTILLQADKLIVSALFPLKIMGYYMLASLMAGVVAMMVGPVNNVVYPRLSQMIGAGTSEAELATFYRLASQLASAFAIPVGLILAIFSQEVLFAYTGDIEVASAASVILSILALAKMLHAEVIIPYSLQLASGWLRFSVYVNIGSVLWIVPAVYFLGMHFGPEGAAFAWLLVTCGYVLLGLPVMHRHLHVGKWKHWFFSALFLPTLILSSFLLSVRFLMDHLLAIENRWQILMMLGSLGVITFLLTFMMMPELRQLLQGMRKETKDIK